MKYIRIILIVTCATLLWGCNGFLETVPDNRTEIDSIDKIKALLVSAYPERSYALILEPRCDGFEDFGSTFTGSQPQAAFDCAYTAFRWDEYARSESGNDSNEYYWMSCYEAIAAANHALVAIETLGNNKDFAPYRAEARLCRAYAHFMLLSLYSNMFDDNGVETNPGIPYVTEPETVVIKQYERETVSATLEKIKEDLSAGLAEAGNASSFSQPKFHFTKEAALAFAVRFALFTKDYNSVITYANQLLPSPSAYTALSITNPDGSPIEVPSLSDYASLYCERNLFDWVQANAGSTTPDGWGSAFSSPANNNNILSSEVVSMISYACSGTAYSRYALGRAESLAITLNNVTGKSWAMPSIAYTGDNSYWIPKYYTDPMITNVATGTGVICTKIALFRLEEVLLSRAEAYVMTGQTQKAIDDLNLFIRKRIANFDIASASLYPEKLTTYYGSEISNSKSFLNSLYNSGRFSAAYTSTEGKLQRAILMTCLDFRRVEYIHEGMRWFDILRWNIPVTHALLTGEKSTLTPDDDRRVIQIPQTTSLSGLTPNEMTNIQNPW